MQSYRQDGQPSLYKNRASRMILIHLDRPLMAIFSPIVDEGIVKNLGENIVVTNCL